MIQRRQTLFLLITLICLTIITFGATIFQFDYLEGYYKLNSYGIYKYSLKNELIQINPISYYFSTVFLLVILLLTIFSFKNLKRQLFLGRLLLFLYFILLIFILFGSFLGNNLTGELKVISKLGLGFYLFIIGFPFIFFANIGINKDIKLLDSLNRLR
jgi:hypothetical protein